MNIRLLKANEIDVRVGTINEKGATLLLYKDARVDMNILDESGIKWKRSHELINNNLFCTISVWDGEIKEWISRQDVGVESNTEKEKGQASDAFKRAGFNFGIGRELYSAPFTWISADKYNGYINKSGKPATYDKFVVESIGYDDNKEINALVIKNTKTHKVVFEFDETKPSGLPKLEIPPKKNKWTPSDETGVTDDQRMFIASNLRLIYGVVGKDMIDDWLDKNWHTAITTQAQAQELIDSLNNEQKDRQKEHDED